MSTNKQSEAEKAAIKEFKENARSFALQKPKRETKLVRVSTIWHKRLKLDAADQDTQISKLIDQICRNYYEAEADPEERRQS